MLNDFHAIVSHFNFCLTLQRTPVKKAKNSATASSSTNDAGEKFWELDDKKRVSVRSFRGKTFVDIRAFYDGKDGKPQPGKQGITLQLTQWRKLLDVAEDITKELESQ